MHQYPVSSSVLSAAALQVFIRKRYALVSATCTLVKTFVNDTYLVDDRGERYVFRVYTRNWRSEMEIREELKLINIIKENNISVSYPIADQSGEFVQNFHAPEGERYGVLFSFAAGRKLYIADPDVHYKAGQYVASIHRVTESVSLHRPKYDAITLLLYSVEKFETFLVPNSDEELFIRKTQQHLLEKFREIDFTEVRQGAVHLDLWADNMHVDENGNITAFDFDFCGIGALTLDVAFYLLMLPTMISDDALCQQNSKSFLEGYESITKLTNEEKRIIPMLGAGLSFYYMGAQSQRFSTVFFNEEHLKRFINFRLKTWMEKYNML